LHLHKTVVLLFLLLLTSKVVLLVIGKNELLQKFRSKTKVLEIVLGTLVMITGFYLFFIRVHHPVFLYGKIILVLVAIPLGIIGLKKEKWILAVLSLFIFIYVYGVAETKSLTFKRGKFDVAEAIKKAPGNPSAGDVIYQNLCVDCHGIDGKKGLFKAPDLSQSKLNPQQRFQQVKEGKGIMKSYSQQLSDDEIREVLAYIETLK